MEIKAIAEHRWLQRLIGEWTFTGSGLLGAEGGRDNFSGRETVRRLGEFWIAVEAESTAGGAITRSMMTLSFDLFRRRYVGTWAGSMMPALWVYDGQLDSSKRVLTLETEGPSFEQDGHIASYRDLLTVIDDDTRRVQSFVMAETGRWREFMFSEYKRVG